MREQNTPSSSVAELSQASCHLTYATLKGHPQWVFSEDHIHWAPQGHRLQDWCVWESWLQSFF